jgi:hypothetical protein
MGRVRISHREGEVAPNTWADFEWIAQHRDELYEQYGSCVLLVYNQQVLATGKTIVEAEAEAERNAPPEPNDITPVLYVLGKRPGIREIRSTQG